MSQASGFKKRRRRGATGDEGVRTSADGADSSWRTPHIAVPDEFGPRAQNKSGAPRFELAPTPTLLCDWGSSRGGGGRLE